MLKRLSSAADGSIAAVVLMASGDEVEAVFTTEQREGIVIASPDRPIFEWEEMDAPSVRAIIAAVVAFNSVAAHSSERCD